MKTWQYFTSLEKYNMEQSQAHYSWKNSIEDWKNLFKLRIGRVTEKWTDVLNSVENEESSVIEDSDVEKEENEKGSINGNEKNNDEK